MKTESLIIQSAVFACVFSVCKSSKVCSYYGEHRYAAPQSSLSNCSWFSNSACCRRTEVTSVLGGMYKINKATQECKNRLNYMMCYFCSPDQMDWYDENRVIICSEFCEATYKSCKSATFNNEPLLKQYETSSQFCEAQSFQVISGTRNCFNFDPNVFDTGGQSLSSFLFIIISLLISVILFH
ncbi:uncharacterized protein LOC117109389 [Anneissia japonica]|uniref:uncharacterized protein LOC117109389 n=1 Tax=Anneissia japonica TaxID=1529436 RepID=UPI0014255F07|nr:uncharacterized protein LOC117109389 [Anneissia japonica]